ncbi:DUF2157 domain-containing protein [Alteromonas oceanisediminis]|uniref:DUF2157 domain-containing protein n=1 Tax=Alteromonas oceanisediminis TaxID=2836180 RepID=UPI001BD98D1A|nr:DUF2157 domain-containing protein [Alteromonas oceanisediminis]MBT0588206.1 DUF2157 domain-containing protein [Alteromonas oceanisediminis]
MKILTPQRLSNAVTDGVISEETARRLEAYFETTSTNPSSAKPRFDFTHTLYYLGGMIAIGAMTLFMNLGWEQFGGWAIVALSVVYGGAALALASVMQRRDLPIPAALCVTFTVALTPLCVYGLQTALGIWPDETPYQSYHRVIEWHWLYMELATLAVGAVALWRYRYPLLMLPVAVTLWYLSMDVALYIAGEQPEFELRTSVSLYVGLVITLIGLWIDLRTRDDSDYSFWLYVFGLLAFWGGLTAQDSDSEWSKLVYCGINLVLIFIGVALVRRVFVLFGAVGVTLYLGHLSFELFQDSWLFPIALSGIGLMIVWLGIFWQRNQVKHQQRILNALPSALRNRLMTRQRIS